MSDSSITTIVAGVIQLAAIIGGIVTLWIKLRYSDKNTEAVATKVGDEVKDKIDENTEVTKKGAKEATENAKAAADTADQARQAAQELGKKLNGGVDEAIEAAVRPIREALQDLSLAYQSHAVNDEKNMQEIRKSLLEIQRNIK